MLTCATPDIEAFHISARLIHVDYMVDRSNAERPHPESQLSLAAAGKRLQDERVRGQKYGFEENLQKCGLQSKALSTEPMDSGSWSANKPLPSSTQSVLHGNQARSNLPDYITIKRRMKPVLSVSSDSK